MSANASVLAALLTTSSACIVSMRKRTNGQRIGMDRLTDVGMRSYTCPHIDSSSHGVTHRERANDDASATHRIGRVARSLEQPPLQYLRHSATSQHLLHERAVVTG